MARVLTVARHPTRFFGPLLLGIGLIAAGLAAYPLLSKLQDQGTAGPPADFSAIPVQVQFSPPALSLRDLQGDAHSLADYRGQVVLVNLWATWCPPCQAEMPNLQAFYERHRREGFTVIAVEDGDPPADVSAFLQKHDLHLPVWLDPTYQATDHVFKTVNLPSSYVLDRGGVVRLEWLGAISMQNLELYVEPLVKE